MGKVNRRGQGATEYLMVFGAVLLIAMVAVVLLGFFTQFAGDAQITSSNTYWRSEAEPFAVLEHTGITSNGTFYLRIENTEGREKMNVTGIALGNASCTSGGASLGSCTIASTAFAPGESRIMAVTGSTTGTSGSIYELGLNISYVRKNGIPSVQYGTKNLAGRYSE